MALGCFFAGCQCHFRGVAGQRHTALNLMYPSCPFLSTPIPILTEMEME